MSENSEFKPNDAFTVPHELKPGETGKPSANAPDTESPDDDAQNYTADMIGKVVPTGESETKFEPIPAFSPSKNLNKGH